MNSGGPAKRASSAMSIDSFTGTEYTTPVVIDNELGWKTYLEAALPSGVATMVMCPLANVLGFFVKPHEAMAPAAVAMQLLK